ncbi:MAG: hypothetical protein ACOX3A_03640 [bacterium]
MTHSLHRSGEIAADKDFVWFMYQSKGINDTDIAAKAKQFIAVVEEVGSVNWGDVKSGPIVLLPKEEVLAKVGDKSRLRGVFTSKEQVVEFLKKIKEQEIGLSVVISGLLDNVLEACKEAGVTPHTINFSLGVFGNKERLPDVNTLAITTMCGHHMVPTGLVDKMRKDVAKGKITPDEAALKLATFCPCGIFNQVRAAEILRLDQQKNSAKDK